MRCSIQMIFRIWLFQNSTVSEYSIWLKDNLHIPGLKTDVERLPCPLTAKIPRNLRIARELRWLLCYKFRSIERINFTWPVINSRFTSSSHHCRYHWGNTSLSSLLFAAGTIWCLRGLILFQPFPLDSYAACNFYLCPAELSLFSKPIYKMNEINYKTLG